MKNEQKQQIAAEIELILSSGKISQNQLSHKVGISPAHLINVRDKEKHGLVSSRTWQRLNAYFSSWKEIATYNLNGCVSVCRDAQENARMLGIYGETGYGKTTALKHYARKNQNAFYVLADCMMSRKGFLKAIAESLGIESEGTAEALKFLIIARLNALESPLLMIDDAGKLDDKNFRVIQILFDATEGNSGFVLAGMPYLKNYIDRSTRAGKMGFGELARRVGWWEMLDAPTFEEVEKLCSSNGVKDAECIRFIFNSCKNFGTIKETINTAKRVSETVDIEVLESLKLVK